MTAKRRYALPSPDEAKGNAEKAAVRVRLLEEERAALVREIVATQEKLRKLDEKDRAVAIKLQRARALLAE